MNSFSAKLRELAKLAEKTPAFYELEITFSIRLNEGNESYYLRLVSDADSLRDSQQVRLNPAPNDQWF